ncbi:MAG: helicase-exonuclease AddAB subunit AddA, partial [Anaerovoracaceae bacterium]
MNWTLEQQKAIELRNSNILVAAAAGSGKTAVLVERIKRLIIEEGVSLDEMLIVTFTNAAAAEMKEKVRVAINKEIEREPEKSQLLRKQLNILYRANISTFHAFALEAIRKFFYLINIEPNFKICDEAEGQIIKGEAMDQLLENYFQEGSQEFFEFLKRYSSDRNEEKVRNMIFSSYNVLQSLPNPWEWLDKKVENLNQNIEEFKNSEIMESLWNFIDGEIREAIKTLEIGRGQLEAVGLDRLAAMLIADIAVCQELSKAIADKDFEAVENQVYSFSLTRMTAKGDEKETYAEVKEKVSACRKKATATIKGIKEIFFSVPLEKQIAELNETYPWAKFLKKLLLDFDILFKEGKAAKNLVDFNDIEHYCIEIFTNDQASEFYREKFKYIFIDEYQDTNLLQEEIISRIKRDNNLFMVGDIKQSIYKFRLAEPSIFKGKYNDYGKAENLNSEKVDLNKNYRSKPLIIKHINSIFQRLMEDYDDEAKLYEGSPYTGEYNYEPTLQVVDMSTIDEADIELQNMKNAEFEALAVADIIMDNLGKPYTDIKTGETKKFQKKDIVVLMRSVRNYADIFYRTLQEKGVSAFVDDNDGYFDTMEINMAMNLLSVIDNRMQDVPLLSVLRSEIFNFSIEELCNIRVNNKKESYYNAFMDYAEVGENPALRAKCALTISQIDCWKKEVNTMPLDKFIWKLLLDTDYYLVMGAMASGTQRQANLRALVDKALNFQKSGKGSLYSFVKYIDAVKVRKVAMGQVKLVGENDDLVRIMTVHKSKGLEFPMVILAGLGKKLNYSKGGKGVILHKDLGIGMSLVNPTFHWYKNTILQRVIYKQIHLEEIEEEVRVLYVALTRAKDKLVLTGTVKDGQKYLENLEMDLTSDGSYLSMLGENSPKLTMKSCDDIGKRIIREEIAFEEPPKKTVVSEEVQRRLNYEYPYQLALRTKSKYSVTELNKLSESPSTSAADGLTESPSTSAADGLAGSGKTDGLPTNLRNDESPSTSAADGLTGAGKTDGLPTNLRNDESPSTSAADGLTGSGKTDGLPTNFRND